MVAGSLREHFAPESCHGTALPQTPHWSTGGGQCEDLVAPSTKVLLRAGLATAAPLIRPGVGGLLEMTPPSMHPAH